MNTREIINKNIAPVVLILSTDEESITALEIVKNILQVTQSEIITEILEFENCTCNKYICDIRTKYYHITVNLVPCKGSLNNLPKELLRQTEAIIIYFNANERTFLQEANIYNKLLEEYNNIELGLLLTERLCDDATIGITYEAIKVASKLIFDVIELCPIIQNDEDEDEDVDDDDNTQHKIKIGYGEILEALNNHLWSNIPNPLSGNSFQPNLPSILKTTNHNNEINDDDNIEEQLESYDLLLRKIQYFKYISANMNREEMLDEAEKLAELFSDLLVEE